MTGCANCGNERIMLCPFCEHDFSERSKNNEAELRQLRREVALLREVAEAAKKVAASHEGWIKEGCFSNPTAPRAGQFWNEWVYEQLDPALKALEKAK